MMKPRFSQGVALNPSQSAYPELWRGLRSSWPICAGVTGDIVRDFGFNRDDASTVGIDPATDWTFGEHGAQLDFVGDGQYLTVAKDLGAGQIGSIVSWVKPTFGYNSGSPFSHNIAGAGAITGGYFYIYYDSSTSGGSRYRFAYRFAFGNHATLAGTQYTSNEDFQLWTPVIATWDNVNNTQELWVNGVSEASGTTSTGTYPGNTGWRLFDATLGNQSWTGGGASVQAYDRVLTDEEIILHSTRPAILHERRQIFIPLFQGAGSGVSIDGSIAALTLAGQSSQVDLGANINGAIATLNLSGQSGQVDLGNSINGSIASLNISGLAAQVDQGVGLDGVIAALSLAGVSGEVSLGQDVLIDGSIAALNLSGQSSQVDLGATINGSIEALSLSGVAGEVSVGSDVLIDGSVAALNLSGQSSQVDLGVNINGGISTLTLSGLSGDVSVTTDISINGSVVTLTLNGNTAQLVQQTTLNGTPATISLSGNVSEVTQNTLLDGSISALTLSGQSSDVLLNAVLDGSVSGLTLTGVSGSITSGAVVTILHADGIEISLYDEEISMQ